MSGKEGQIRQDKENKGAGDAEVGDWCYYCMIKSSEKTGSELWESSLWS